MTGAVRVLPRTVAVALVVGIGTALVSAWGRRRAGRAAAARPARRRWRRAGGPGPHPGRGGAGRRRRRPGARRRPRRPGREHPCWPGRPPSPSACWPSAPLAWSLARLLGAPIRRVAGVAGGSPPATPPATPTHRRDRAAAGHRLALAGFLATLAASTKASAAAGLDRTLRADFRLEAAGAGMHQPLLSPRVAERLAGLPELAAVAAFLTPAPPWPAGTAA